MTLSAISQQNEIRHRTYVAGAIIIGCIILQSVLIARLNINWDEYWFLGRIYLANANELRDPFQNFHVQPLSWVGALPLSAIDQIVIGRYVMLGCELVALLCLFVIGRRLADTQTAVILVVFWFGGTYALAHGASFRTDPLSAALMMAALALMFCGGKLWHAVLAGVLAAISLLITVKVVFYLPAFLAALLFRFNNDGLKPALLQFAIAGTAAVASAAFLWAWHASTLAGAASESVSAISRGAAVSGSAAQKVVGEQSWFPRSKYVIDWISGGFVTVLAIAAGVALSISKAIRRDRLVFSLIFLLCAAPLLTLAFYRNAYAYYFPFIVFPCLIAAIPLVQPSVRSKRIWLELALGFVVLAILAQALSYWPRTMQAQRAYSLAIERMFPQPVPYIERSTMLPHFQKTGFFMSSWGLEDSALPGRPGIAEAIAKDSPPLLIASSSALRKALKPDIKYGGPRLTKSDEQVLRENYIQHWGAIWVAGKDLSSDAGSFAMAVPGTYTLECYGQRAIDGVVRECGSVISLSDRDIEWSGGPMTLRWGDNLPRPEHNPPKQPVYYSL